MTMTAGGSVKFKTLFPMLIPSGSREVRLCGQDKPEQERFPAVAPDNENGEPGPPVGDKPSKKDAETKKYAL